MSKPDVLYNQVITFVVAVNDDGVLESNLLASPLFADNHSHQIIIRRNYASAAQAYNDALDQAVNGLLIFAHQDVFLPKDWMGRLGEALDWLYAKDPDWGVAGCFGVTPNGRHLGHVYSSGLRSILGQPFSEPVEVQTLDEMVLILRKPSGLRFDEYLPYFHFYGTDICMAARERGLKCYVVPAFCIHNSNAVYGFPKEFYAAYRHVKARWRKFLPIRTTCTTISQMDFELWRTRLVELGRRIVGVSKRPSGGRVQDPARLWKEM